MTAPGHEEDDAGNPARTTVRHRLLGAVAGLLAAVAGLAAAQGVTALLSGVTGPYVAVGNRAIDWTPRPLKEFAIETFGDADKLVLLGGIGATLVLLAALTGAIGARHPRVALGSFALLSVVAGAAVVTDRSAAAEFALRLLPVAVLAAVSLIALYLLLSSLRGSEHADTAIASREKREKAGPRVDRRRFLVTAAAATGVAVVGGVLARAYGGLAATAARAGITLPRATTPAPPVPAVDVGVDGVTPYITPNPDFYRVDTALQVPDVPLDDWTLRIFGMVDREVELSFDDLLQEDLVERRITLTCVSNEVGGELTGNATWLGVPVRRLLERAGVQGGADAVRSRSYDDFTAGTPLSRLLDDEEEALVAIGMNGEPLPLIHGFPARLVTPGLYGYVSATKWLTELEVTRFADFKAYWTTRDYSAQAPIKHSSRIDVPRSFARLTSGQHTPIAGVAWAQPVGVAKVEVRIDGEDWQEARLGAADNPSTWRQWAFEWEPSPGNHIIDVRATDRDGNVQTESRAPIAPDGSTGWHSVTVQVA